jgi:hypothetical protein
MRQRRLFPGSFPLPLSEQPANKPTGERKENYMKPHKLILIPILLVCFGLLPKVQAVGPDTDGNIAGANNGEGVGVLVSRFSGTWNTGTGFEALNNLTSGNQNTATGVRALFSDINGGYNAATGVYSLYSNTAGFYNSATGAYTLTNNSTGLNNTAIGYGALYRNTIGNDNIALGTIAGINLTIGDPRDEAPRDQQLAPGTARLDSNGSLRFDSAARPSQLNVPAPTRRIVFRRS